MTSVSTQKDRVASLKNQTIMNLEALNSVHNMSSELKTKIFQGKALEKPTQNLFYQLSYYLLTIINKSDARGLSWPLYDTAAERAFRNGLSKIISNYSSKGLVSPVMSSYFVNPGCYKITVLLFEMSKLALERTLAEDNQELFDDLKKQYHSDDNETFLENVSKSTEAVITIITNHMYKRKMLEDIAEHIRKNIIKMESTMSSIKPQDYLNNLVQGFLQKHDLDETTKKEIINVRNINEPSEVLESWLSYVDKKLPEIEKKWDEEINPFLKLASDAQCNMEMLIARQTGKADKSTYMLEFNPKTDNIHMKNLMCEVNMEQKYILKNIITNDQLSYPYLIRGFLVAMNYVQQSAEDSNDVYTFKEYLEGGRRQYLDVITAMEMLVDRVMLGETKLQSRQFSYNQSCSLKDFIEIPPLPDLSDLKMVKDLPSHNTFDTFTPLNVTKQQFNLQRKCKSMFTKPQTRPLFVAPLQQGPRDDFLKSLISYQISSYNRTNTTQNLNMSIISQTNVRNNETIAECSTGFTKQQILRLLSTKKSSSSKKFKTITERPSNTNIKKGGLFNKPHTTSTESKGLYRCYSSPNLLENHEKQSRIGRKLSKKQEDNTLLEVSGISALGTDNSYGTPEGVIPFQNPRKLFDTTNVPIVSITPVRDDTNTYKTDSKPSHNFADVSLLKFQDSVLDKEVSKSDTPQNSTPTNNSQVIPKTRSLEKIINRFKKVRASVMPSAEKVDDFKTIAEEKENMNMLNTDVCAANRVLLPDLLSPSYDVWSNVKKSTDYTGSAWVDTDVVVTRNLRESLGTALGVDHTFLDKFDLAD